MMSIRNHLSGLSADISSQFIAMAIMILLVLAVLVNAWTQIFLKDRSKPPVVFHWLPIIGSTITYGMDPLKFFQDCREKVRCTKTLKSGGKS